LICAKFDADLTNSLCFKVTSRKTK